MSLLDSDAVTALRAIAAESLGQTATVSRLTRTSNSRGGFTESYATAGTVACRLRLRDRNGQDSLQSDRIAPEAPFEVSLLYDADVLETDRLVIDGLTYEIRGPLQSIGPKVRKRGFVRRIDG